MGSLKKALFLLMVFLLFTQLFLFNAFGDNGNSHEIVTHNDESKTGTFLFISTVILLILVYFVLKVFSTLLLPPIYSALVTNTLIVIVSVISGIYYRGNKFSIENIFNLICAFFQAGLLFVVYITNSSTGRYKHSTKSGGRDNRYKSNPFISGGDEPIIAHCVFSFMLLVIIGVIWYLIFYRS